MTVDMQALGQRAKAASRTLKQLDTQTKNALLRAIADTIDACSETILEANAQTSPTGASVRARRCSTGCLAGAPWV